LPVTLHRQQPSQERPGTLWQNRSEARGRYGHDSHSQTGEGQPWYTQGLNSYASQACLERIIEKIEADEMPAGVLPVCFGILRDKERADLGQAAAIVEHKRVITVDEVKAELDAMKAEVIDITPNGKEAPH
jgi:hypothetical protein